MFSITKEGLLNQERIDPHSIQHSDSNEPSNFKNSFLSDLERILFSSSFRRLQDKAQVYPLEPEDYARTRLTHSLEVSAIALSLGNMVTKRLIRNTNQSSILLKLNKEKIDDMQFIELNKELNKNRQNFEKLSQDIGLCLQCASLLHDIGNPPFGHFGEDVMKGYFREIFYTPSGSERKNPRGLNEVQKKIFNTIKNDQMKMDLVHFDGNAQTIRIVTKLQNSSSKNYGLNLTYGVLGALFKYPYSSEKADFNHQKFGYLYSENDVIEKLLKINESDDIWAVYKDNRRNPLTLLMEAADDIGCIISDFEDAVHKTNVRFEDFFYISNNMDEYTKDFTSLGKNTCTDFIYDIIKYFEENSNEHINEPLKNTITRLLNRVREDFKRGVVDCFINNYSSIIEGTFTEPLMDKSNQAEFYKFLKQIRKKFVFNQEEILIAELQGKQIIRFLLDEFLKSILHDNFSEFVEDKSKAKDENHKMVQLISKNYIDVYKKFAKDRKEMSQPLTKEETIYYQIRVVIDHICGMTDTYAKETYIKLNGTV